MTWREKLGGGPLQVSLAGLFEGTRPVASMTEGPDLDQVIDAILRPGFPAMTALDVEQSGDRLRAYTDEVARIDIPRLADVRHTPDVIKQLVAALARSTATEAAYNTLAADVRGVAPTISAETIGTYIGLLRRLFIVEPQPSWTPKLRSRARLRTSPKLHLVDASLSAAALGAGPQRLRGDLETLGMLFESSAIHDLTVYASALGGEVRHYRDSNGKEIDAIIIIPDGRWGAIEVKLGGAQMGTAAESLKQAIEQIDTDVIGEPAFRLVVTGTGPILTADDGTVSSSLSALAP